MYDFKTEKEIMEFWGKKKNLSKIQRQKKNQKPFYLMVHTQPAQFIPVLHTNQ